MKGIKESQEATEINASTEIIIFPIVPGKTFTVFILRVSSTILLTHRDERRLCYFPPSLLLLGLLNHPSKSYILRSLKQNICYYFHKALFLLVKEWEKI